MATKPNINVYNNNPNLYNLSNRGGTAIKYIAIHYTAGTGSAKNNCIYFSTGNRSASADFFIDPDGTIWQFNPNLTKYYTWEIGGGSSYGPLNRNSVGIEFVNTGNAFTTQQIKSGAALVQWLMSQFGIPAGNVVRHYDCNSIRKHCPAYYIDNGRWNTLRKQLTSGTTASTTPAPAPSVPANAKNYTVTASDGLNVRSGAGKNYNKVKALPNGTTVSIVETKTADGFTWGKLYDGSGWVALDYTSWKTPTNTTQPKPVTNASGNSDTISVDGSWGEKTTRKAQRQAGTSVDGVISNQPTANKKHIPSAYGKTWEWKSSNFSLGSSFVKQIQKKVGAKVDGFMGAETVRLTQKRLQNLGYNIGADGADSYMGKQSTKAFQQAINDGKFF